MGFKVAPEKDRVEIQRYTKEAIALATKGQWQEAVQVNKAILELAPGDVDAFNRLGRALMKQGDYSQAKAAYNRSLELDPYNSIAKKNLDRLSDLAEMPPASKGDNKVSLDIFITEAGKSGVVTLINLAPKKVLAKIAPGEEVNLQIEKQKLLIKDEQGEYLGEVEPKYGQRLAKLMEGGNRYVAAISSLGESHVKVIIHEIYQHPDQAGRLSFPQKGKDDFRSYTRNSFFRQRMEDEEVTDEDEELPEEYSEGFFLTEIHDFSASGEEQK